MAAVKYWFLSAISLVLAAQASADDLETLLAGLSSTSAAFRQTTTDTRGLVTETLTGQMWLAPGGRFRWEVRDPYEQSLVIDGRQLFLYDPELEQVTIQPIESVMEQAPVTLLNGDYGIIEKTFAIERWPLEGEAPAGEQGFLLTPRSQHSLFKSVLVRFRGGLVAGLGIHDHLGHRVNIEFSEVEANAVLESRVFQFEIPPGADVIGELIQPG